MAPNSKVESHISDRKTVEKIDHYNKEYYVVARDVLSYVWTSMNSSVSSPLYERNLLGIMFIT